MIYLFCGFIVGKNKPLPTQSDPNAQCLPALIVPVTSHPAPAVQTGLGLVWGYPCPLPAALCSPPGATRDIGSALTRMCMRHRSIEAKLRQFTK